MHGFQSCWDELQTAISIIHKVKRYSELADCLESLFHLAAAWGELEKAKEAGVRWRLHLDQIGEPFISSELAILDRPNELDTWGEFLEQEYDDDADVSGFTNEGSETADHRSMIHLHLAMATMISSRPGTPPDAAKEGDAHRPNQAARLADVIIPVFFDTLYSTVETSP